MRVARNLIVAAVVTAVVVAAACKEKEAPKMPLGRPAGAGAVTVDTSPEAIKNNPHAVIAPAAQAALDSGNALYRAAKYKLALAQYRQAAKLAPANAAPYYGIYMAADKMGNKALADSAMSAVNKRAENANPMFADSLMKKAHLKDSAEKAGPTS